jgi:hypothetical protein
MCFERRPWKEILPGRTAKIDARKVEAPWIAKSVAACLAPLTTPDLRLAGKSSTSGPRTDWHASQERAKIEALRP